MWDAHREHPAVRMARSTASRRPQTWRHTLRGEETMILLLLKPVASLD
jgi:hypothetical protein